MELTDNEKIALVSGVNFMETNPVPKKGIPALVMADGPHGLRKQIGSADNGSSRSEPATAFPTAAATASSWNPENMRRMGETIAKECRHYGVHMLLGPGCNIKRDPLCGRNFEYFSEDPLLSGEMASAFVQGLQENGVGACIKHFALNNEENYRFLGNSVCDERAMREIYLKASALREMNRLQRSIGSSSNNTAIRARFLSIPHTSVLMPSTHVWKKAVILTVPIPF